jgi:hypothetical protein
MQRSLTAQEQRLAAEKKKNLLLEQQEAEELRHAQSDQQLREQKRALKKQKREKRRSRRQQKMYEYKKFLEESPPHRVIDERTAELITERQEFFMQAGIIPFSLERLGYAVRIWHFELSSGVSFVKNRIDYQQASLMLNVLPNIGKLYKGTISIGVNEYINRIQSINNFSGRDISFSPFFAGNITLPELLHAYFSLRVDARQITGGISLYPFYDHYGLGAGFFIEQSVFFDTSAHPHKQAYLIQAGVKLKPFEPLRVTLAFEDYRALVLGMSLNL